MTIRWRRVLFWLGTGVAVLLLACCLAFWFLLRSGYVYNYVLRTAHARASAAAGVPVTLGAYRLQLRGLSPTIDLYDVTVPGAPPYGSPPFLQLPHARVQIRVISLYPFRWRLREIAVDRPVVHLLFAANGRTNLPHPPAATRGAPGANLFQLAIARCIVRDGEAFVNGRAVQLNADLRHLQLQAAYDRVALGYRGSFSFSDSALHVAGIPPLAQSLSTGFLATPAGVTLSHLRWSMQGAVLTATATLRDYVHPAVNAGYRLQLETARLRRVLRIPELPRGSIALSGAAAYTRAAGPTTSGQFSSVALTPSIHGIAAPFTRLQGRYRLARGALSVTDLRAGVLGGTLQGSLSIRDLLRRGSAPVHTAQVAHLQVNVRGARLEQAAAFVSGMRSTLGRLGIGGRLSGAANATWQGAFRHLAFTANGELTASLNRPSSPPLPLQGSIQASYAEGLLDLSRSELRTPQSYLTVAGTLGARSNLQLVAVSRDLREIETVAGEVSPVLTGRVPAPLGLSGAATFRGSVTGTLASPAVAGRLNLAPFAIRGSRWRAVSVDFAAGPAGLILRSARLDGVSGGVINASGALGLQHWSPGPASPLRLALAVHSLPLTSLAALTGRPLPLAGMLSVQANLAGVLSRPQGRGIATLSAATLRLGGVTRPIRSAELDFEGTPAALTGRARVLLTAGGITASGEFHPATGAYQAKLEAPRVDLGQLQWFAVPHPPISGVVAISAHGSGTLRSPAGQLTLSSSRLVAAGQAITALNLHAALAHQQVQVQLAAVALQTPLHAQATVSLSRDWPATARVDAPAVPLAPLLLAFAPSLAGQVQGRTAIQADLNGPLRNLAALQAHITIPTLGFSYPPHLRIAAAAPLRLTLAGGVLTLAPAALNGTDTNLTVQARVPLRSAGMPSAATGGINVALRGQIGLRLAELFAPGLTVGGEASLDLSVTGPMTQPVFGGQVAIANASVSGPTFPLAVSNGQGQARLSAQRLDIVNFTADVGGGLLTATGGMTLRPAPRFDFAFAARNLGVRYPDTVREQFTANLALVGTPAAAHLTGRVQVNRVSVLPGFDFTSLLTQLAAATPAASAPGSFAQALTLQVAVSTPNRIVITTRDFSIDANANVNVRGTAAEPILLGRIDLNRGDLIFNGRRYELSAGTLDFANPARTEPAVNVSASTTISQYNLQLNLQGPASNLRATYTSNPPLPPADIINLLAFGSTTEASAANTLPGNLGAENLIAGAVSGQITGRVQKLVGISQLSVDPVLRTAQQNAGARITVQQRVTANLFVTFSTDTTGTTRNVVEIQYSLTPRVSFSAVRDQNGGFGVNTRFKKVW